MGGDDGICLAQPSISAPETRKACLAKSLRLTCIIDQGSRNFHSYLIAKRTISGGMVTKAMDFAPVLEKPANKGSCERLTSLAPLEKNIRHGNAEATRW